MGRGADQDQESMQLWLQPSCGKGFGRPGTAEINRLTGLLTSLLLLPR